MPIFRKAVSRMDERDRKHIQMLWKSMLKFILVLDFNGAREAWFWIQMHCSHKSRKIR